VARGPGCAHRVQLRVFGNSGPSASPAHPVQIVLSLLAPKKRDEGSFPSGPARFSPQLAPRADRVTSPRVSHPPPSPRREPPPPHQAACAWRAASGRAAVAPPELGCACAAAAPPHHGCARLMRRRRRVGHGHAGARRGPVPVLVRRQCSNGREEEAHAAVPRREEVRVPRAVHGEGRRSGRVQTALDGHERAQCELVGEQRRHVSGDRRAYAAAASGGYS
jgi:hypothetical protein